LTELLVVLAIIGVLIGILLPAVSRVRRAARSTKCLAHLQQWGQAFATYVSANNGRSIPSKTAGVGWVDGVWWELLAPGAGDARGVLLCPEAPEPRDVSPDPGDGSKRTPQKGAAQYAWRRATYSEVSPQWKLRGDWRGGYAFNEWVYYKPREDVEFRDWFRLPAQTQDSTRIPLFVDCPDPFIAPTNPQLVPGTVEAARTKDYAPLNDCVMDRHGEAVNVVFLDGHAEAVPLLDLWKLKWSGLWK
jgi:prepilin-type processing-associated H-X9-DG protein